MDEQQHFYTDHCRISISDYNLSFSQDSNLMSLERRSSPTAFLRFEPPGCSDSNHRTAPGGVQHCHKPVSDFGCPDQVNQE